MLLEEFKKLSSADKLNIIFELFTNHFSEHDILKSDIKDIKTLLSEHTTLLKDLSDRMPNRPL